MTKKLLYPRVLLIVMSLIFSVDAYSQLPSFNFSVTATNQTCLNNGVLNFTVSGTQPGAGVSYAVYLLPNTTTPVITTANTTVPGLGAGNYSIIATQSLNGQTSLNIQSATINNLIIPLTYTLAQTKVRCGNDGVITVTVTSGYPATYEILSGPVTKPPQASNTLTGLPVGQYDVRVTDTCGEAVVTHITVELATTGFTIGPVTFPQAELVDCNHIIVVHDLTLTDPNNVFFTPLTIQYTVFPPGGGAPIVVNGGTQGIPFYNNQQYSYNIKITDACGNVFTRNNNIITPKFNVVAATVMEGCGNHFFDLVLENFVPPFNVTFTASPPGFVPVNLNINHPNFSETPVHYGGDGAYAPDGAYTAVVVDACGRSFTVSFTLEDPIDGTPPQVGGSDAECGDGGSITMEIQDIEIVDVSLTGAPPGYPGPFPVDVSAGINADGEFEFTDLPPGTYVFVVTDECGHEHDVITEVGSAGDSNTLTVGLRQGCELGYGSISLVNETNLASVTITAAPSTFTEPLPFNVSANIASNGAFYMNSLPAGNYTFEAVNICGTIINKNVTIPGYTITQNGVTVTPHCGSFDVNVQHLSNGTYVAGFYLQKYFPESNAWGHPQSGNLYVEGGAANTGNSMPIVNNTSLLSLAYTGEFRVIKTFFIYDNGTVANIRCVQVLHTFTFGGAPEITDAYSFPCADGLTEVAVIAEGIPPLTYSITEKEGLPFDIDNGESNLFTGLESATYNFRVTDVCGNIRNILLDIDALDPVAIQAEGFCEGEDSKLFVQEFDFLEYKWYKEGAPGTVLGTTGTLNFPAYESATDAGVYHLSVTSDNPLSCMNQVLSFSLLENSNPNAGDDMAAQLCNDGESIDLRSYLAEGILKTGEWEDVNGTGLLTNSTLSTTGLPAGTYQFKYTVYGLCNLTDDAMLSLEVKDIPQLPVLGSNAPVCVGSELQLSASAVPGATHQWAGPNGFSSIEASPILSDISANAAGEYSLVVTVNGCASLAAVISVEVNAAPRAGEDAVVPLCNEGDVIDLTDYLSGTFDTGGIWEDVDGAGSLNGNNFATEGIIGGTYRFRYTVENICNSIDEAIISVQLKDIPQAPTLDAVAPVCEGTDIQLSASTVTDAVYQWVGPNGFASNEQNPLIPQAALSANGDYSVNVTVNGCTSAQAIVPVTINAYPQFTVEGNTVLCEGQASLLTVVPDNFTTASYQWYLDGNLLPETSATLPVLELGNYEVIVDNNSCTSSREMEVTRNENPFEVLLDAGCVNYDYMLWVANLDEIPGAVVTWTGPANFSFSGPEANITNKAPGEYTATVTNSEGCTEVASIMIDYTSCIIPKGVSPNGDGLNDTFDLSNLEVIELKIFNRYGLKVYEARNYLKEWYGQSDKGTLPTGTYYYVITLYAGKQATGWVYLQREEN